MKRSKRTYTALGAIALLAATSACGADDGTFPNDDIEIIVPFSAGAATDVATRAFAEAFEAEIGENVQVINREGGSSTIGLTEAANAEPDGHTLVMGTGSTVTTVPLLLDISYSAEDFVSVAPLIDRSYIAIVKNDSDIESIEDLVNMDERYTYSTFGNGHWTHFAMANFVEESGSDADPVPFGGTPDALQAVENGQVDVGLVDGGSGQLLVDGEYRAIATTADERLDYLPDVPTFAEAGYEGASGYTGRNLIATQSGVPEDRLEILKEAANAAYESDTYTEFRENNFDEGPIENFDEFYGEWAEGMTARFEADMERLGIES